MFSSLLQLMGFPAAKPLHSRATEKAAVRETEPKASIPQEQPVRRSIVKTSVSKTKIPAVQPAKAAQPAKAVKTVKVNKAGVTKTVPQVKAKAAAKAPAKPVAPAVVPTPPHSKKKSEPVTRVVETKAPATQATKPVKSKPVDAPAAAKPPVAPAATLTSLGVPVRSGRPSSRLAQLTVPSMAQSVASNAAKASFTQMTTSQPILSPLASTVKKDPKLANNWKKKPVEQLSDEEIIAMSDEDYMNDTQMAYFRLKLVNLKNAILSSAGETTEHLREDTVVVPDPADRATIEEEHALELRTRDRERKLLKKIDQSINRIDAGDYGYCDETGEPIGVARLLARPTATLSLEAQQRRELKQKMFGD